MIENSWFSQATFVWRPRSGGTHQNFCLKHPPKTTGYCMVKIA